MVATATIIFVSECLATATTSEDIFKAADGLETKLNEYHLLTGDDKEAKRLLGYYYSGVMAKYKDLIRHRTAVRYLKTKYDSLMKRKI